MSENVERPEAAEPVDGGQSNREAAKYRRQLRETEQKLESVTAALTIARGELLRSNLSDYRVGKLTFNVDAFADAGLDVDALFGEDGQIATEAVDAAMTGLLESRPYMFTEPQRLIVPNEGNIPDNSKFGDAWKDAFKP